MEVSRIRALRGPNLWSRHTAIEAIVCCTEVECNIDHLPGFENRLRERFPELAMLRPLGHEEAVSMAQALEFAALGLQAQAGCPVTFSRTAQTTEAGTYQVVVEYSEEAVGRLAFELAQDLCRAAVDDTAFRTRRGARPSARTRRGCASGPEYRRDRLCGGGAQHPYRRLTEGSMVQFGWGSRQRRIQAAETDRTSAVAESIAQDKELSKVLLHAAGVPVPTGRPVLSAEDAWAAACEIDGPVVVKPQDGNQGKGVAVNLSTREQIEAAYAIAFEVSDEVLVERYMPGHDYRLLVVGDKLIAAARRDPPLVIGDGVRNIRQLVERVNQDPRRSEGHATSLTRIRLDEVALARLTSAGLTPESIPARGQRVVLRNNANLSTGGTATDVTDDVHPDFAAQAVAAAQTIGLDIAGVDVVCDSVLRPLEDQGGGIVEINAAPGLRMHLQPSFGKGRPVGEAIIANMFAAGDDATDSYGCRRRNQRQDDNRAPDRPHPWPARSARRHDDDRRRLYRGSAHRYR
jgi:cyanophycin synthetase